MEREVTIQVEERYTQLGETDRVVVGRASDFVEHGQLPEESINEDFFNRVTELNAADTEQTRESRMHILLQAGMDWLEGAKEPGLNLLNIAGRTGLIVALTVVLRQVVAYNVEHALREGDSPEASRAWAVVAISMIGPALTLVGAIRNECDGTANPASRLGRVCMASITMGALIAAHLTGASQRLLPAVVGGSIYTLARGLANVFIPLHDNANPATAATTGVATAVYGVAQFLLAELGQLTPLSGAARAAAELGYSLGADAIQGLLTGLGVVVDDLVGIFCKSSHMLSPSPGMDSVFSDPQALQQMVLEVRASVQRPTPKQLLDALFDIGAMRLSVGYAIALVTGAVASLLSHSEIEEGYQGHVMSGCLALMAMIIYFPLIFGSAKRTDNLYELQETAVP
ncbi:hypothetical protein [Pseudomonas fluorescens]|nr:hypothetical protein [Pseudomonas fluorescens]